MSSTDPFGLIGQVLDGQFRVDKFVGEGGFSVVYRGHHVGLDEPIAIKCLKLPIALGSALVESFVKRFRDESRLHYRLSQGSLFIVRTLASGTTMAPATGALVPYMVLEWLEGRSLGADLEVRRAYGDKGRSLEEAVALLDSAVDGIAYAHAQGVVHRDVNPGNLFMTATSQGPKLKVLDFGVAKVISDHALALGPRAQTIGQIRIFSPQYAAPEQFDDKLGPIGTWTDVYSVALIVLEVMRDEPAITGEHLGDFASRALDPLVRPTPRALGVAVPDETEAIFASAVALKSKERPQDAGEFWGSLKAAMQRDRKAGNPSYSEPPKPASAATPSSHNTLTGPRVQPGRTLSIERVPIPVRPSESSVIAPISIDMPPETARMPAAPGNTPPPPTQLAATAAGALAEIKGVPGPYAAQRATPPPPADSLANPSMPLESAVPPTPPATEVKIPAPPPPVPNAFEQSPPARTGSNPALTRGPDTLTGSASAYPPSLLGDAPRTSSAPSAPPIAFPMVPPAPTAAPTPAPSYAPVPAPGPSPMALGASVPTREVTGPMAQVLMGTVMLPRPSSSAAPPAVAPVLANAASQPPPNVAPFPPAPPAQPVESLTGPDSDGEKPTRIGSGALDVFAQLYTAPPRGNDTPPPPPPPVVYAPAPQAAVPTVTTRPARSTGLTVILVLVVVAALVTLAYGVYHATYGSR